MPALLMLLALLAGGGAPHGAIEATIRGTAQPLEVELLLRDADEQWKEVGHQSLPSGTRHVRFEGLTAGVYQLLVKGPLPTEQLATKLVLGRADRRRTTVAIEPFELTGRVMHGGVEFGAGALVLRHNEMHWKGAISIDGHGNFRARMWQRGEFTYTLRGPALPTAYSDAVTLDGVAPRLTVDVPEARITGVVRDAKSGAPVAGARVALQTSAAGSEQHVRVFTDPEGKFDFTGLRAGRQVVRVSAPAYVEPEPLAFELDVAAPFRELDLRLDSGRTIAVLAIDDEGHPAVDAAVFAAIGSRVVSRATTDEDGRASVVAPAGEDATLFVIGRDAGFGIVSARRDEQHRIRAHLPSPTSSLVIRARTSDGGAMPPFSLLMRYNGTLVPTDIAEELAAVQRLHLATGNDSEVVLHRIPSGTYEFWPYRTPAEAESIAASAAELPAPIQIDVRPGENNIAVKFAAR